MTNLPEMAGSARELTLDGSTYRMRPLSIDDFAEFEAWVDDVAIRQASRNLDGLSTELQIALLERAQDEARKMAMQDSETRQDRMSAQMASMGGICYLVWLSIRREHPDLSVDDISQLLTIDRLPYVQMRLDSINGFASPSPKRVRPKAPRKRAKRK